MAKLIVTLLIFSYVFRIFRNPESGFSEVLQLLGTLFTEKHLISLAVLFLLVPLNWALESIKWRFLAQKAVRISFSEAFRSTLTGLAVGVAVPAQLGDTIGRITSLKAKSRLRALGAALVSNGIQFYVSIAGGSIAWFWTGSSLGFSKKLSWSISALLITILIGGILLGLSRQRLLNWKSERLWIVKLKKNLAVVKHYSGKDLTIAFSVGFIRYLVFVTQFTMAFILFEIPVSTLDTISSVGLIYLVKTLLPAINAIGDLGIREFTALYVFAPYHVSSEKVMAATFLIWLLNILAPLLVGVYFIWKYKWSVRYA
ncbi:lysylphosphatidylglycerol synthase domain-containing protein [Persicitalea jodogahamensis]|uniref:lysylphosphatidylglycerol synthase domain-containing protein n=1 Tax=Persicitalea jodogahamensis TaxID=402147 RepID=UPI0035EAA2FE